jgi:hypothetical protein
VSGLSVGIPVFALGLGTTAAEAAVTGQVTTYTDSTMPGMAKSGERAIWELGQIQLYDGGASGSAGASGATLFEDQGVFVP